MENTPSFCGGIMLPPLPAEHIADTSIIQAQPPTVALAVSDAVSVREGDEVLVGTNLGISREMAVYSSVSGRVREIKKGRVIIENDGKDRCAEPLERDAGTPGGLVDYMRKISLVGMGGAGFPTAKKYENCINVKALLINACECEPHLSCDRALIANMPKKVIRGAQALSAASGALQVYICAEHADLLEKLKNAVQDEKVNIVRVSKKFPQGSERQLIYAVLHREVPRFRYPKDSGAIVSNCATAAAFAESLETGIPPVRRIVTVSTAAGKCANILAPCGTNAKYLLDICEASLSQYAVIEGGAMTGRRIDPENAFVTLTTTGYTVLTPPKLNEKSCIHCGGCVRVCPARIQPYKIDAAERLGDIKALERLCADACISCGCCSFVCPAKRELTEHTTAARKRIFAMRRGTE